jgi:transcriptional regulator with XRE-family HTH domain
MVRNSELKETRTATKLLSEVIRQLIDENGLSQYDIAEGIGKSQSYASLRIKGLKPWTTDDLDIIAGMVHCVNAFGLLDKARGIDTRPVLSDEERIAAAERHLVENVELAANRDSNKEAEKEYDADAGA